MEQTEHVKNTPPYEEKFPSDNTDKKRTRYVRKPKSHVVLTDIHMAIASSFTRLEVATYEMEHHMLATDFPQTSEREIDDATKLLHDLGYIFLIPRDTHKPNVFQLDKKGAKLLVGMGVDRDSLSVYTGDVGYLDHKEMRAFFGAVLTHALNEGHTDMEAWEREYILEVPKTRDAPKIIIRPDGIMRLPNQRGGRSRFPLEIHTGTQWSARIMSDKISRHIAYHDNLPATDGPDTWHSLFITKTKGDMEWLRSLAHDSPSLWFICQDMYQRDYQSSLIGWTAGDGSLHTLTE